MLCLESIDDKDTAINCFRQYIRFRNVINSCVPACPEVIVARSNPSTRSFDCYMRILEGNDVTASIAALSNECSSDDKIATALSRSDRCDELSFSTAPWASLKRTRISATSENEAEASYDLAVLLIVVVVGLLMIMILAWSLGTFKRKQTQIIQSVAMMQSSAAADDEFDTAVTKLSDDSGSRFGQDNSTIMITNPNSGVALPNSAVSSIPMADLSTILSGKTYIGGSHIQSYNINDVLSDGNLVSPKRGISPDSADDEDDLMETVLTSSV